jgi:hypothetical protein
MNTLTIYSIALFRYTKTIPAFYRDSSRAVQIFSYVSYPLNCVDESLSVSPYGSWINGHDRDISVINNQQWDLEIRDDSHLLNDDLVIVWTDTQ